MIDQIDVSGCPHSALAVGWALHALEPAEESVVAAHLAECPECTRAATDTEYVGAALGLSLPEQAPSPALEQHILAGMNTARTARAAPQKTPQTVCVTDAIAMLSIMLIVLAVAAAIVFYLV